VLSLAPVGAPTDPAAPVEIFAALPVGRQRQLLVIADALDALGVATELGTTAGPRAPVRPCGTWAAYKRHHRWGEAPCEACKEASRSRDRGRVERRRARAAVTGSGAQ
jgi:hypothetical protein